MTSSPPEVNRVCVSCSAIFRTRWRYARCSTCRYQESYKNLCRCGAKKSVKAITCMRCAKGGTAIPNVLARELVAWIAGLLEGEGTFIRWAAPRRGGVVRIEMTDEDVIARMLTAIGIGRLEALPPRKSELQAVVAYHGPATRACPMVDRADRTTDVQSTQASDSTVARQSYCSSTYASGALSEFGRRAEDSNLIEYYPTTRFRGGGHTHR
jgi:hypothetical protein